MSSLRAAWPACMLADVGRQVVADEGAQLVAKRQFLGLKRKSMGRLRVLLGVPLTWRPPPPTAKAALGPHAFPLVAGRQPGRRSRLAGRTGAGARHAPARAIDSGETMPREENSPVVFTVRFGKEQYACRGHLVWEGGSSTRLSMRCRMTARSHLTGSGSRKETSELKQDELRRLVSVPRLHFRILSRRPWRNPRGTARGSSAKDVGGSALAKMPASDEGGRNAEAIQADVGGRASRSAARAVDPPGAGEIPRPGAAYGQTARRRRRADDRGPAAARSQFPRSARRPRRGHLEPFGLKVADAAGTGGPEQRVKRAGPGRHGRRGLVRGDGRGPGVLAQHRA